MGAQGDSIAEAKRKLEDQMRDLTHEEAMRFFRRGAPAWLWARYWFTWVIVKAFRLFGAPVTSRARFKEPASSLATC